MEIKRKDIAAIAMEEGKQGVTIFHVFTPFLIVVQVIKIFLQSTLSSKEKCPGPQKKEEQAKENTDDVTEKTKEMKEKSTWKEAAQKLM